jgi:hypothetical protein
LRRVVNDVSHCGPYRDGRAAIAFAAARHVVAVIAQGATIASPLRRCRTRTPKQRCRYRVLVRCIDDIAGRVQGFGGAPVAIKLSPTGGVPACTIRRATWAKWKSWVRSSA